MRYLLILTILLSFVFGDNLSTRLEHLIQNKHEKKVVFLSYNPFQVNKKEKKAAESYRDITPKKQNHPLDFITVMNKKAFINGRWFKAGDIVAGYKIEKIYPNKILVNKKGVKTTLGLGIKENILKIRENKHEN
ncbi:MAG: hypothetical protein R3331_11620 [Sulfurospirillaceae bacterium]|nr:hypothetical protein [Sulfurospirillaceae bacterium]